MAMHPKERLQVLKMIDIGTIAVDEAFQLPATPDSPHGPHDAQQRHLTAPSRETPAPACRSPICNTGTTQARASLPLRRLEVACPIGCHYTPGLKGVQIQPVRDSLATGQEGQLIEVADQSKGVQMELWVQ